ncbi:MAG TPA: hypothetical protein VML96_07070 [Egibacteraceae bacterium]|nr:hypothetical protein [Egibacteraceae bacterium]
MIAHTPVAAVGSWEFDRADIVLAAVAWNDWSGFETRVGEGLACESEARRRGESPSREELAGVAGRWRRARSLVAAEDLRAWLSDRRLSSGEWTGHLRREVLRARYAQDIESIRARAWPPIPDVAAVLGCEGLCSGYLRASAEKLVSRASVTDQSQAASPDWSSLNLDDLGAGAVWLAEPVQEALERRWSALARLDAGYGRFCDDSAAEQDVAAMLRDRALDWTRLRFTAVWFPHADAAAEAALMVAEDDVAMPEIAAAAGLEAAVREDYADKLAPALAAALTGAVPGETVGPLALPDGHCVAVLVSKRAPSVDDRATVTRAREELITAALARATAGRIRWHEHL